MEDALRLELTRGLELTDSPYGIASQLGRCLHLAVTTIDHPHHHLLKRQLERTIDILEAVKSTRRGGFVGDDLIEIRVNPIPNPDNWESWFRRTHWGIVRNLAVSPGMHRCNEIDAIIVRLNKVIAALDAWTESYNSLAHLLGDWFTIQ